MVKPRVAKCKPESLADRFAGGHAGIAGRGNRADVAVPRLGRATVFVRGTCPFERDQHAKVPGRVRGWAQRWHRLPMPICISILPRAKQVTQTFEQYQNCLAVGVAPQTAPLIVSILAPEFTIKKTLFQLLRHQNPKIRFTGCSSTGCYVLVA